MSTPDWVQQLFTTIDRKDTAGFIAHLSPDVRFRFANAPILNDQTQVKESIAYLFQAIAGLKHTLLDVWEQDGTTICRGEVCYTRHDGSTLEVPFINVLKRPGETIDEYLIYVDASELFSS
jgi:ketosteroid isomerase-like protein